MAATTFGAPGVYVLEVPSTVKPIAGVGTSTAAFIGYVEYAEVEPIEVALLGRKLHEQLGGVPAGQEVTKANVQSIISAATTAKKQRVKVKPAPEVNEPKLCTYFGQFANSFGGIVEGIDKQNWLAHAVYGFFMNGGTRCWVVRMANEGDVAVSTAVNSALAKLEAIDEVALVAVPGATVTAVQQALLDHCQSEHLQDRFAILDGKPDPVSLTPGDIIGELPNSSYGAIYFPWLDVGKQDENGKITPYHVPPSGYIAGIYARVDTTRGVHKAPANEVIRGVSRVKTLISKEQQAGLNPVGINVIRKFNGNVTVWGARTWADVKKEPEWAYVNVRRLFLFLRESIDEGTQWVVFEPNTPDLWAKITRNITAFLTTVWRDGALFGDRPEKAFYVKCDAETNPPDLRDLGQVVTEIGVAVTKPAEFVIFRISQWAGPGK